jgi:PAS domain S-box-containing protein
MSERLPRPDAGSSEPGAGVADDRELSGVFFDEAPDGIIVGYFESESGIARCTQVNAVICQMLGYAPEELVGMRVIDLVPPEEAALFALDYEVLSVPGRTVTKEVRMRRKDGTWLQVEGRAKLRPDGRWHAFVRDISARKRAERECDESLRWMRAVHEQAPVGLILVQDPRGEQVEFNARGARMALERLGRLGSLRSTVCTMDGQPVADDMLPIARALRGERLVGVEYLMRDASGGSTPIAVNAGPIVGSDGAVLGAVVAFEDIRAPKELERLRAEWSSVVAHDLRQPLASIALDAEMLVRTTDHLKLVKYADRIRTAAGRLNRMVGDLMDVSRLDAHRLELVRRRVDMPALVRACVERYALAAPDRPFDVRIQGNVPYACADPDRVEQAMENLLTNAIKYGMAGSPVIVTVGHDDAEVAVAVTNDGRALSAQEIARLFERFQRTDSARREGIQGVGLGLYITRSLVEAHGGRMSAESAAQGATTFRFTLPVGGTTCGQ